MGGGRNGCFRGAPILNLFVGKCCVFSGFLAQKKKKTEAPPENAPLDAL